MDPWLLLSLLLLLFWCTVVAVGICRLDSLVPRAHGIALPRGMASKYLPTLLDVGSNIRISDPWLLLPPPLFPLMLVLMQWCRHQSSGIGQPRLIH